MVPTTVENHTQATSTVTVSTPTALSRLLVDHTPKAMAVTPPKKIYTKG